MDNRSIGIFDSGVGGLTVTKHIFDSLPHESTIYVGDTARIPYGSRSPETIFTYSTQIVEFLLKHNVKAIVVACSTASSLALPVLSQKYDLPIIGVIKSSAATAARTTRSKKVAVIGTRGTINSQSWETAIKNHDPDIRTLGIACPLFVPFIEEGITQGSLLNQVVKLYLGSLKNTSVDTLVLGCTHYPLIHQALSGFLGPQVTLIDPGTDTAKELKQLLQKKGLLNQSKSGRHVFFSTDDPDKFTQTSKQFLGNVLSQTTKITL